MSVLKKVIDYSQYLHYVSDLVSFVKNNKILLNRELRKNDIDKNKQIQYIENFLIGLPLFPMIFDASTKNKKTNRYDWIVVDGHKRLCALVDFFDGKIAIDNHRYYNDLSSYEQSLVEDKRLEVFILNPYTDCSLRYEFFERMNPTLPKLLIEQLLNQNGT